jgi:hypothetical protein
MAGKPSGGTPAVEAGLAGLRTAEYCRALPAAPPARRIAAMEIRFTVVQTLFGLVFGAIVAHYLDAGWWVYALAIPATGAVAYLTSLWRLRTLGLKPDATFLDFIGACRKRWR